jgi:DNA-directed RNA polymerase specialized sigma24 family protein
MASQAAYDDAREVPRPARPDRRRLVSDAYDQHGTALFRLAHAICGDEERAATAVVQAFDVAFTDSRRTGRVVLIPQDLVRLTYLACVACCTAPPGTADGSPGANDATPLSACLVGLDCQRRALIALTLYGDHTYDEAAVLLHIDPAAAARALRITLREAARGPRSRHASPGSAP